MVFVTTFAVLCLGAFALSAPTRYSSHCFNVDSIRLDNSDKYWLWSSFIPRPKVRNLSYKTDLYNSNWLMFVSRVKDSYSTTDIIELAHQDERDPSKCRFLIHKKGSSSSLRFSGKIPCKPLQNQNGYFKTSFQLLANKQQFTVGTRPLSEVDNMYIGFDKQRQRLTLTSLRRKDMAWWNVNFSNHPRCAISS